MVASVGAQLLLIHKSLPEIHSLKEFSSCCLPYEESPPLDCARLLFAVSDLYSFRKQP